MTRDEIMALEGRELDAAVETGVMGNDLIPPRERAMAEVGMRQITSSGQPFHLRNGDKMYLPPGATLKQPEGTTDFNLRYGLAIAERLGGAVKSEVAAVRLPPRPFSTDANACRIMEAEIGRRGLGEQYAEILWSLTEWVHDNAKPIRWQHHFATRIVPPETCCRAALLAVMEASDGDSDRTA